MNYENTYKKIIHSLAIIYPFAIISRLGKNKYYTIMRNLMRVCIHNLDTCTRVDKIMGVLSLRTEIGLLFSYSIRQKNNNSNIILHFSYVV